jgi:autoinducer 2-degrading protein
MTVKGYQEWKDEILSARWRSAPDVTTTAEEAIRLPPRRLGCGQVRPLPTQEGDRMYALIVQFDVDPDFPDQFILAALRDGRDSMAAEPGTLRFELIADAQHPNRFYLSESYADQEAFEIHEQGEPFKEFIEAIQGHADDSRFLAIGDVVDPETHTP